MKFSVAAAILAVASVASAQVQLTDPTEGVTWTAGVAQYIRWTGNCASMGADGKAVKIDIVNGPADNVKFVVDLGVIDCTSPSNISTTLMCPTKNNNGPIASGSYALRVNTIPPQYTTYFTINNPDAPSSPATPSSSSPPTTQPSNKPSSANTLAAGSALAVAALAIAQLVL
ncbi:hypothetical protein BGZ96_008672 [Linnemannia gamsii]|uniref:Uncharacterized protein n=1 Tax=Linnemannia gamsii TaxID=64522 RepID=A0ABQ7JYB7_9FUNG|nr:hypothetical protein BGZ96_008672 [Linnemannia gamsii]